MFLGFAQLDVAFGSSVLTKNSSELPVNADSAPVIRIYGSSGLVASGTLSSFKNTGSITNATNASPIVITSTAHGLVNGMRVTVTGVGGNTNANTTALVANKTDDTFELAGTTGNGAYTSGGTWNVSGLYAWSLTPTEGSGYAAGEAYVLLVTYAISSTIYAKEYSFVVT